MMVRWPLRSTRCSLCHLTARASTWLSVSRPRVVKSSTVQLWWMLIARLFKAYRNFAAEYDRLQAERARFADALRA